MRLDGSVSENLLGDFCFRMVDSTAISGRIILILMLDQFSQRRKLRHEQAHSTFLEVTAVLR